MTKDEALQMCLEYIETDAHERKYVRHAIKAALEAKDEPVACKECHLKDTVYDLLGDLKVANLKLSARSQRTWVGLTDKEIYEIGFDINVGGLQTMKAYKAIEANLKEKNHDY